MYSSSRSEHKFTNGFGQDLSADVAPGPETSGLHHSVFMSTPPEACCVLPFRANMSGTTQTG